jgi:hypothetical protein
LEVKLPRFANQLVVVGVVVDDVAPQRADKDVGAANNAAALESRARDRQQRAACSPMKMVVQNRVW